MIMITHEPDGSNHRVSYHGSQNRKGEFSFSTRQGQGRVSKRGPTDIEPQQELEDQEEEE